MSDESSKTNKLRGRAFMDTYFHGKIIDIGCGKDKVVPEAEAFDLEHGNAQTITEYREINSYDCVHSSHCLEHMRDVPAALSQWWKLVKPGGYLIITIPDEDLYEQGQWPSLFNSDHKATFRLQGETSWSPVSYNVNDLFSALEHSDVIDIQQQNSCYNFAIQGVKFNRFGRKIFRWKNKNPWNIRYLLSSMITKHFTPQIIAWCATPLGQPVDQTAGRALAQIQVVVKKNPN